jgi:glutaredoxin 3
LPADDLRRRNKITGAVGDLVPVGLEGDGEALPRFAVTVFTMQGCPYCIRAKAVLKTLSLEWEEIDVGANPCRRKDMVDLTGGAYTVPQVFFDNEHIGDCSRVAALSASGELAALALAHQEALDRAVKVGDGVPPLDPRLWPMDDGLPYPAVNHRGAYSAETASISAGTDEDDRGIGASATIAGESEPTRGGSRHSSGGVVVTVGRTGSAGSRRPSRHAPRADVGGGGVDGSGGGGGGGGRGRSTSSNAGRRSSRSLSTDGAGIDNFIYVAEKHFKYSDLLKQLCEVLDIRSRRYRLVVYEHVFVGSEATTAFQKFFDLPTRAAAVTAGRELLRLNVFQHVTNEHDFKDAELFYRLQLHSEPLVLNSWRSFASQADVLLTSEAASTHCGGDEEPPASTKRKAADGRSSTVGASALRYSGRRAHRILANWCVRNVGSALCRGRGWWRAG